MVLPCDGVVVCLRRNAGAGKGSYCMSRKQERVVVI